MRDRLLGLLSIITCFWGTGLVAGGVDLSVFPRGHSVAMGGTLFSGSAGQMLDFEVDGWAEPDYEIEREAEARVHWSTDLMAKPEKREHYRKDDRGNIYRVRYSIENGRVHGAEERVASSGKQGLNEFHNYLAIGMRRGYLMVTDRELLRLAGPISSYEEGNSTPQPEVVDATHLVNGGGADRPLRSNSRISSGNAAYQLRKVRRGRADDRVLVSITSKKNKRARAVTQKNDIKPVKSSGRITKPKAWPSKNRSVKEGIKLVFFALLSSPSLTALKKLEEPTQISISLSALFPEGARYKVSVHNTVNQIEAEATAIGIDKEWFYEDELPLLLSMDGMSQSDWGHLMAFYRLARGDAIPGSMHELYEWIEGRRRLHETQKGKGYLRLHEAYIDLCLLHVSLKFGVSKINFYRTSVEEYFRLNPFYLLQSAIERNQQETLKTLKSNNDGLYKNMMEGFDFLLGEKGHVEFGLDCFYEQLRIALEKSEVISISDFKGKGEYF